jgi:hypothetical protein
LLFFLSFFFLSYFLSMSFFFPTIALRLAVPCLVRPVFFELAREPLELRRSPGQLDRRRLPVRQSVDWWQFPKHRLGAGALAPCSDGLSVLFSLPFPSMKAFRLFFSR